MVRKACLIIATAGLLLAGVSSYGGAEVDAVAKAPISFSGGAGSKKDLVARYLDAIKRKDAKALHELRVTEGEYKEIIVPGTVDPGKPPRRVSDSVSNYFWRDMDYKSELLQEELFKRYGDRDLPSYEIVFTKEPREYDWYRAWGELRVDYENDLRTAVPSGWIAEVGGRYKFLSFEWDY